MLVNEEKRLVDENSQVFFHKGLKRLVDGLLGLIYLMSSLIGLVTSPFSNKKTLGKLVFFCCLFFKYPSTYLYSLRKIA